MFTIELSQPRPGPVVVDVATEDGTASAPADYGAMTTRITFTPGQTSKTVTVKVRGDTLDEVDENYFVNLTIVSGDVILRWPRSPSGTRASSRATRERRS